jgi:hypothetical protein
MMANTWTWKVKSMHTLSEANLMANYVVHAMWTLTGSDGTHTASIDGNTQFPVKASDPDFVPYSQLTENTVIEWIQADLGENGITNFKANVDGQIQSIISPPVSPSAQPLPWA